MLHLHSGPYHDLMNSVNKRELKSLTLNSEHKFEKHITGICNKASQKIRDSNGIRTYNHLVRTRTLNYLARTI